ncbi:MAG: aldehyde dehydrogenase family protein [Leptospira sp.]|nr:aldehyde dehydrogenase family protein [Leptospira sp.]
MAYRTLNPATEVLVKEFPLNSETEIGDSLRSLEKTWQNWMETGIPERSAQIAKISGVLRTNKEELAKIIAIEMGKPLVQGKAEIEKCADLIDYFSANSSTFLSPEFLKTEYQKSYVTFKPLGIILAIMPWNYPFWQVFRCAIPALIAGNGIVTKHASNVPQCALAIEEILNHSGIPYRNIFANAIQIEKIICAPEISGVSFTGSVKAGKILAAIAGREMKKTILELGGSDPYIVLADADLDLATQKCTEGRLVNNGQSCISAKRFIVHSSIKKDFEELFISKMEKNIFGDPLGDFSLGPLARKDIREDIHSQVLTSIGSGAVCLTGGKIPEMKGYYYPPTILTDINEEMSVWTEETFGPVAQPGY